jgi:hypothetical protein
VPAVRFKCKPIVPVAAWREEATNMFEKLFAVVQPDNISMEMLFFDSMAEFRRIFPVELFDPVLLARMDEIEASEGFKDRMHPFPDDLRAEVYTHYIREIKRLSPQTRVSLCAETQTMWERLADELDCTPSAFACNCGPVALPGIRHAELATSEDGKAVLASPHDQ